MSGFRPLLVSELNADALGSYLANRSFTLAGKAFNKRSDLHFQDIYSLDAPEMSKVEQRLSDLGMISRTNGDSSLDLICGGPPCQGYSGIGHRRSYKVEKKDIPSNQLYEKMAEVIEFFRPKMFLFENVKGLLSSKWSASGDKGEIWRDVTKRFVDIDGYTVRWSLVRARDYGVPQNRPRVLLVGVRNDIAEQSALISKSKNSGNTDAIAGGFLPEPIGTAPNPRDLLSDLVDPAIGKILTKGQFPHDFASDTYLLEPQNDIQTKLRTTRSGRLLAKGASLSDQRYSKHKPQIVEKFNYMLANEGAIPDHLKTKKFAQRVIPEYWPPQGPTITATSLPDDYVHYCQPRSLTVREWARLQMFPDWYEFKGKRTTGGIRRAGNPLAGIFEREVPKYTQIGNAVPVRLAQAIGKHFQNILQ